MDTDKIIEHIREAQKRASQDNPMASMPSDYICVIHPRHRYMLEQLRKEHLTTALGEAHSNMLHRHFGMPIYEENRAPQDKFEFMDLMTYYAKYPPIFPKHYSRRYILWDNVNTMVRRWFINLKWNLRRRG